jgi:hypothetical protein
LHADAGRTADSALAGETFSLHRSYGMGVIWRLTCRQGVAVLATAALLIVCCLTQPHSIAGPQALWYAEARTAMLAALDRTAGSKHA